MSILTVGAGEQFQTIAAAVAASHDGDVVQVQAGTYTNDFAEIRTKITLEGVGGTVNMVATQPIPNGKAILITDTDVTIDNFSFSGATVADGNGAGIRYQGGALTLTNDDFHDNQEGLLAAADPTGSLTIENSEFADNGAGDGYTHNLYVGAIASLVIDNSYFHGAIVGHEIKSRAESTIITNSRIQDEPGGTASYGIDLPNGGNAVISNDIIEQSATSQNPVMVAYGEEGNVYAGSSLQITDDTFLNDLPSSSARAVWNDSTAPTAISGIDTFGLSSAQLLRGPGTVTGVDALGSEPALNTNSPATVNATTVFRFFDSTSGTQFLTSSATERDQIMATRPDMDSEGAAFSAAPANDPAASAVYRFFDTSNGTHFFTASSTETAQLQATRPDLTFEGAAFDEYATAQPGTTPVYRFFDTATGTHFFTDSAAERATIVAVRPDLVAEGIAFYAPT